MEHDVETVEAPRLVKLDESARPNGAADRIDPYWTGVGRRLGAGTWQTFGQAVAEANAGNGHLPANLASLTIEAAHKKLADARRRDRAYKAFATAYSFRVVSGPQADWATHRNATYHNNISELDMLWRLGAVDRIAIPSQLTGGGWTPVYRVARPEKSRWFVDQLPPEVRARICGDDYVVGGIHLNHDLLATELALRIGELSPLNEFVLGEADASHARLVSHLSSIRSHMVDTKAAADLVVGLMVGARLAVEMTTQANKVESKVERWRELLAGTDYQDAALVVMFVCAGVDDKDTARLVRDVRAAIVRVIDRDGSMGSRHRMAERFAVTSWPEWFPAPAMMMTDMHVLPCWMPIGPREDRWHRVLPEVRNEIAPRRNYPALEASWAGYKQMLANPPWR